MILQDIEPEDFFKILAGIMLSIVAVLSLWVIVGMGKKIMELLFG